MIKLCDQRMLGVTSGVLLLQRYATSANLRAASYIVCCRRFTVPGKVWRAMGLLLNVSTRAR